VLDAAARLVLPPPLPDLERLPYQEIGLTFPEPEELEPLLTEGARQAGLLLKNAFRTELCRRVARRAMIEKLNNRKCRKRRDAFS
jgi:hypothetical protein